MGEELKVGQRIGVYNVIVNNMRFDGVSIGKTYVGYENQWGVKLLGMMIGRMYKYPMLRKEVKQVGYFVVREVYSNRNPCTII